MNFEFHYNLPCGSWLKNAVRLETERYKKIIEHELEEKEASTMQVTYNGFTGELVKLEKKETGKYTLSPYDTEKHPVYGYDLSIYDSEKQVTHSFAGVKLEDVKFLDGAVTFGG